MFPNIRAFGGLCQQVDLVAKSTLRDLLLCTTQKLPPGIDSIVVPAAVDLSPTLAPLRMMLSFHVKDDQTISEHV